MEYLKNLIYMEKKFQKIKYNDGIVLWEKIIQKNIIRKRL